jgi:lincosamide nucleotidyltransferase A/C/D/E
MSMKQNDVPEMTAEVAVDLVQLFKQAEIEVILDGGWGVDALLGEQTRAHSDLDIVIAYQDVLRLRMLLEANGYADVPRSDTRVVNFVMGDNLGHLVDIHTYTLDRLNHPEQGLDYPLESLSGMGSILGNPVRCIDQQNMVNFHTGYTLDEIDYHDVKTLCERFGIPLPLEYAPFAAKENLTA